MNARCINCNRYTPGVTVAYGWCTECREARTEVERANAALASGVWSEDEDEGASA